MRQKSVAPGYLVVLGVMFVALGAVACQSPAPAAEGPAPTSDTPALPGDTATPAIPIVEEVEDEEMTVPAAPTQDVSPAGSEAEQMVAAAKEELMQRLNVTQDEILVMSVEAVQWPDASLGCPQPGMMYAQVITPGFRVVLTVGDQAYDYHTDQDRLVVPCADLSLPNLDAPDGSRLPIFVEIVQTSLSPDSPAQMPPADASPTGVFAFNPGDRLLLVQPSIQILPTTEVLVGLTTATVPGRPYVASELFQIPSPQTTPLSVIAIDADSGTLTLAYADQTVVLSPGQSWSSKQKGEGELSPIEITTIINHGRPAAISLLPAGPANR